MSSQATLTISTATPSVQNVIRPIANFDPSIWGDRFLTYTPINEVKRVEEEAMVDELKEKVRRELCELASKPSQQLQLIDAIQRLGIAYHFDDEIENALRTIYDSYGSHDWNHNNDLYGTALWFRLLRQQGFNVSSEIFENFMDECTGEFRGSLRGNVIGMLAFYEATHLRVHCEDILDSALSFTMTTLESMLANDLICDPLKAQVQHALKQPIRKGLIRLESVYFIPLYEQDALHEKTLLKLVKLDFNLLQSLHKKELSELSRWWKDLDFTTNLPYARDRLVECYFWILGVYFEPQYSRARRILTKIIAMTSVIDDTHDAYGTFEELELFHEAIERWSATSLEILPDYMKFIYQALLDVFEEIEDEMTKEGKSYRAYYAKEAMKVQVRCYFEEAKRLKENFVPIMEEYMPLALLSCGYLMLSALSFVGMGDIVSEDTLKWVLTFPTLVKAASTVNRLMDDIVSHKMEQERGHVASGIECYMKQYGVSEQYVYDLFNKRVEDAWKDINQETLKPMVVEMPIAQRVVNLARVMDVFYKNEDTYTHVGKLMKERVTSLLINPVI